MKIFSFLFLFFFSNFLFCQETDFYLKSSGEMPSFISESSYFVERVHINSKVDFMEKKPNFKKVLSNVVNSGALVFGDSVSSFSQKIVNIFSKDFKSSFIRSNKVFTISSGNDLFISTGLVAQLTNPEQLAFFIAREIVISKQKIQDSLLMDVDDLSTISSKIDYLTTFSKEINFQIDSAAAVMYLDKGFRKEGLLYSMDIYLYEDFPFDQVSFPFDYFNDDNYFIPPSFFDIFDRIDPQTVKSSSRFILKEKEIQERKKRLIRVAQNRQNSEINHEIESNFEDVVKLCQFEHARQCILSSEFQMAIYDVFLLEEKYSKTVSTDWLKGNAWLGCAAQYSDGFKRRPNISFQTMKGESSKFFFVFRKLNSDGILSLSLRIIYDLNKKYNSNDYNVLWSNLINVLKGNKTFDLTKFSPDSYNEVYSIHLEKLENTVGSDKFDQLNSKKDVFDSTKFYLFGIADLIENDFLKNELDSVGKPKSRLEDKSVTVLLQSNYYKTNRTIDYKKSKKKYGEYSKALNEVKSLGKVSVKFDSTSLNYNESSIMKEVFSQMYNVNEYENVLISPLALNELRKLNLNTDFVAFVFTEGIYRPKLKGYHFLGLFGLPLPIILPDFFIKSHQSKFVNMVVDLKTGEWLGVDYERFSEPLFAKSFVNRLFYSLNEY